MRSGVRSSGGGRTSAALLVLVLVAVAGAKVLKMDPGPKTVREFDGCIYALMDSSLCDTCVTTDGRGIRHRVYADSGRVMYQHDERWASRAGQEWSSPVRLNRFGDASSPLVFELQGFGPETKLVVMWQEEFEGRTEVMCRFRYPLMLPTQWGLPLCVTIRPEGPGGE